MNKLNNLWAMSDKKGYSVLPYMNAILSLLSITLFVMSSWYFQSVISTQKEQLLQLIDRQIEIDSQVAMLLKDRQSSVRAAKREILPEIPTDAKMQASFSDFFPTKPPCSCKNGSEGPSGPPGLPGPKGDRGYYGDKGSKGDRGYTSAPGGKGSKGEIGAAGPQGNPGFQGLTGPVGSQGPRGHIGYPGPQGPPGAKGVAGSQGPSGSSGKTETLYIHWGHNGCPETAEVIYSGIVAGANHAEMGGGSNAQCLPVDPEYSNDVTITQKRAYMYGAEYDRMVSIINRDIPCAVCLAIRSITYMVPAKVKCPSGWMKEYRGYLMTSLGDQSKVDYVCVDEAFKSAKRSNKTDKGLLLYPVEVKCTSLPCPPYKESIPLPCVVCSK